MQYRKAVHTNQYVFINEGGKKNIYIYCICIWPKRYIEIHIQDKGFQDLGPASGIPRASKGTAIHGQVRNAGIVTETRVIETNLGREISRNY